MTTERPSRAGHTTLNAVQKLVQRSHLTQIQVDTVLTWKQRRENGQPIKKSSNLVESGSRTVTRGSFYRTLSQAKRNITKSVNTLILAAILGLVDEDALSSLSRLLAMIPASEPEQIARITSEIARTKLIS